MQPRTISVYRCVECPFAGRSHLDYPACCHADATRSTGPRAAVLFITDHASYPDRPPEWCPLRADPVLITVFSPED
jgi:hypothetical protein